MQLIAPHQQIPATWDSLEEFARWYCAAGSPLLVPWDAEVIVSDDATAICVFRQPPFQVELYLIHPNVSVPEHAHPDMEVMVVSLGGGKTGNRTSNGLSSSRGMVASTLQPGETHGGGVLGVSPGGYAFLTFEKWPVGVPMTSAAIHWRGATAGPKQEALIRRHHSAAIAISGFADVYARSAEAVL